MCGTRVQDFLSIEGNEVWMHINSTLLLFLSASYLSLFWYMSSTEEKFETWLSQLLILPNVTRIVNSSSMKNSKSWSKMSLQCRKMWHNKLLSKPNKSVSTNAKKNSLHSTHRLLTELKQQPRKIRKSAPADEKQKKSVQSFRRT